jgi:prophage antirepressor-like protein
METKEIVNTELGLRFNYWDGRLKNERVFVASQIMKQLGYKGGMDTLRNHDLEDGVDVIKLTKKTNIQFFKQLLDLKSIGQRATSIVMLYESGIWKLIMGSKMPIGIKTRNWLAREVLPSIKGKGYYNVQESQNNPLSYLYGFTERKEQIKQSKSINHEISVTTKDYSSYHNAVHKLVNNMTAKEIQSMFNSKESAREIIRQHLPENAATMALIDELYIKYNKNLTEIESTGLQNSAKETFKALFSLGVKPLM